MEKGIIYGCSAAAAHLVWDQVVGGSIPPTHTSSLKREFKMFIGIHFPHTSDQIVNIIGSINSIPENIDRSYFRIPILPDFLSFGGDSPSAFSMELKEIEFHIIKVEWLNIIRKIAVVKLDQISDLLDCRQFKPISELDLLIGKIL
jgi:hypothetical protein